MLTVWVVSLLYLSGVLLLLGGLLARTSVDCWMGACCFGLDVCLNLLLLWVYLWLLLIIVAYCFAFVWSLVAYCMFDFA